MEQTTNNRSKGAIEIIYDFKILLSSIKLYGFINPSERVFLETMFKAQFPKLCEAALENSHIVIVSDDGNVYACAFSTVEACNEHIKYYETKFEEYPEADIYVERNRFVREISFEQFKKLAGFDYDDPNCYDLDEIDNGEIGLIFDFRDPEFIFKAHAKGEI